MYYSKKASFGIFSVFLYIRVDLHKRKVLEQCDLEQEMIYKELKQKKVIQDQTMESIKGQLLVSMLLFIYTSLLNSRDI